VEVIRVGVFETNSSSTHSICISNSTHRGRDSLPVDADGTCRVYPGEFGWEVEEFDDAPTKAAYCLTYLKHFREPPPHYEGMLKKVIAEKTGAKLVVFVPGKTEYDGPDGHPNEDWGYIDHQSDGVCGPAWDTEDTLADFIFNRASILRTDNDNHD